MGFLAARSISQEPRPSVAVRDKHGAMVALTDPQELVGAVLNRTWKLVRVIAQGGLGIVY